MNWQNILSQISEFATSFGIKLLGAIIIFVIGLKFTSWIKRKYCQITNRPCSQITRFKVGNGGLSLRKVSSHLKAVTELKTITEQYLQVRHHLFNEDVFFSIEVNRHGLNFTYPSWQEGR